MANKRQNAICLVFVAAAVAGLIAIPFLSNPVSADRIPDQNPRKPGFGLTVISERVQTSQGAQCDPSLPADSTKGGLYFRFTVPSTITTIKNSNHPENGVNLHISFKGSDGNYYEAGMYYGNWVVGGGVPGYNPNNFQFAWGRGGALQGISSVPVVAGHDVEVFLIYLNSAGNWQAWFSDRTTGELRAMIIGSSTVTVASDLLQAFESNTKGPNTNSQTLGLVTITSLSKATRIAGDGVGLSNFSHGYVVKNCNTFLQGDNSMYGATYLGTPGNYKIGYNAATRTNGAQLW